MSETRELPKGWAWATVEQVSERIVDCLHSTAKFTESGFLCVDTNCIKPGRIVFDKARYVDEATFIARNARMKPRENDVMFSREGTVGIAVRVPEGVELCLGQRMMIFRPSKAILSQYYETVLNSSVFRQQYAERITGTTSPHLNIEDIRRFALPLPPLGEQERIVAAIEQQFTRLDAGVAALRRARAALKRYRAAVLTAAAEGRLTEEWRAEHPAVEAAPVLLGRILAERRARWEADLRARGKDPAKARYDEPKGPDVGSLPGLPEGWCWATLALLSATHKHAMSSGPFGSALGTKDYKSHGIPVIRGQNIGTGQFIAADFMFVSQEKAAQLARSIAHPDDLVVVAVGSSGKAALVPQHVEQAVLSQNCNKITLDKSLTLPKFIAMVMQTDIATSQLRSKTTDTVRQFLSPLQISNK